MQAQFDEVDRLNIGSEFVLFYSKSPEKKFPHLTITADAVRVGSWNNHWRGTDRPTMRYELMGVTPESGQWRWSEERSLAAMANYARLLDECGPDVSQSEIDEWWFSQSPIKPDLLRLSATNRPEHYVPPSDRHIMSSLWTDLVVNESGPLQSALQTGLANPKRTTLIHRIVNYATNPGDIVLDSFAGSGTTAHAVLALNREDGGNRKFILVECEDYADSITAERVRRVSNGAPNARDAALREGLGGSFTYCTLGEPIDVETMLTGEHLPEYAALAAYLLHTATGVSVGSSELAPQNDDGLFYGDDRADYYLLYRPDLQWLRSNAAIFNEHQAERIYAAGRPAIVFAADKFIGQRFLTDRRITFCQLPYEMHRPV